MTHKVLVTYASKYGATGEIAKKIGEVIGQNGFQVEVLPISKIGDLSQYNAIILGSAAYIGGWRKEAVRFLTQNEESLSQVPVWIFSSGPTGEGDPLELLNGWRFPNKVNAAIERIKPHDTAVFHGSLVVRNLNFVEKFMIGRVKAATGDFRDWEAISKWADGIATSLKG